MQNWKWYGYAAHFICSNDCRFHLATLINDKYMISTVGDYRPDYGQGKMVSIGCERNFETMVFEINGRCDKEDCMCGLPLIKPSNLDFSGYMNAKDATHGHMQMCKKWDKENDE